MIAEVRHLTTEELEAGLDHLRAAPRDHGTLRLIVRRPRTNERELPEEAALDPEQGLVGDRWAAGSSPRKDMQLTLMNVRSTALVAQAEERWALAGDQLYVDLDLSGANLPPGTRLAIGSAIVEVSAEPHTGCSKFVARFGVDAMRFVNSPVGRELNLRGINTRIVQAGTVRVGDTVRKL